MTELTAIAAMTQDRVIGKNGGIPWDIPEDQEHFYDTIRDEVVIVGRRTAENIDNTPPSDNIILSRSKDAVASSKGEAIQMAEECSADEVFIIGGGTIYGQFLDVTDRMILSFVDREVEKEGNITYFPEFDMGNWKMQYQKKLPDFTVIEYDRV